MRREVTLIDAVATALALAGSVAAFSCALLAFVVQGDLAATAFVGGALALGVWAGLRLTEVSEHQAR